ncbi:replicative DNA helicase [Sphingomonas sp.]|uniref:replicative DNA helicase n=1 Tax=Sphingomonas sp. TaxID=28214 RepID=UPI001DDD09BB|nr:replicative DNA helicase [Sphingomonas sp.]MBX9796188.1 replicative DNA helicase [Sphingomonas sp.]
MATAPVQPASIAPRALPHNLDAEAALLGAMLIDSRIADDMLDGLSAEHFFEPLHGRILEAVRTVRKAGLLASPVTLKPMFDGDEGMAALGGTGYLTQLTSSGAAGLLGARDFAQQLRDLAMLRTLIGVGRDLVDRAFDTATEIDPRKQIEVAEEALFKIAGDGVTDKTVKSFDAAAKMALQMVERAQNAGGGLSGITTGLDAVNSKTSGLHKSDLIILAGRPGMGKTSLATNIAFNAAQRFLNDQRDGITLDKNKGTKVAFFSLEMSADQLATRILAEQSQVPSETLRKGGLTRAEMDRLIQASIALQELPLYIDDTAGLSIAGLHTRMRRLQRKHDGQIGLVVVDYLQLLSGSARASDNRVNEISEISRGLKTMAKDLGVAVLALSQLSRAVESREDKRPQLSDLRESGSIEQDADMVWFVYRDDYYHNNREPTDVNSEAHRAWAEEGNKIFGLTELLISKHRHGATGKATLFFDREVTRFSDYAGPAIDPGG